MDAVHFGRWVSERRRASGWRSQKAFVEAAHQDPFLSSYDISEDFLARLEAGRLAHPFRKGVRRRVIALTWLLCKTPREVRAYLQAAELTDLTAEETTYVTWLNEQLAARRSTSVLFLPPRPSRLVGRTTQVQALTQTVRTLESGVCVVTGMPGVGKSVLAAEVVHQIASNERERVRLFPDGIAAFSGTGRRGVRGLMALLQDIGTVFSPAAPSASKAVGTARMSAGEPLSSGEGRLVRSSITNKAVVNGYDTMLEAELAEVIDHLRQVLADKRVLLVLDEMDAQFPLRRACEALLAQDQQIVADRGGGNRRHGSRVLLITSRYIPAPALVSQRLHLEPLEPDAARDLLTALIGQTLSADERTCAEQICAAVGFLPLAIEAAASTVTVAGVPLALLAERVTHHPLDALLDGEGEVHARLAQALAAFDAQMQQRFALLSSLGTRTFALESAVALRIPHPDMRAIVPGTSSAYSRNGRYASEDALELSSDKTPGETTQSLVEVPSVQLASAAADLGQFVRHSLVEVIPHTSPVSLLPASRSIRPNDNDSRYRLHPLLYAHAMERLEQLEPEIVHAAQRNVQAYAFAYAEHYCGDVPRMERERELLLAVLTRMWQQEQYPLVVRFLANLLSLTSRLSNREQQERLLQWGIHASQQIQDQHHLARFLSYLGKLHLHRGQLTSARQLLEQSLAIVESLDRPTCLWGSLGDLAHIAHILGDVRAARGFTQTYIQRAQEANDPIYSIIAHYLHGCYARLDGDLDRAYDDLKVSLCLISTLNPGVLFHRDSFSLGIQAELARVEGDYARSQAYTEAGVPLAQVIDPPYLIADMLYDQACFAYQQGVLDDARSLALRVIEIASQIEVSHLYTRAMNLLRLVPARGTTTS